MILAIGEILFDHFPGYRRIGGAPLNFSYHLNKLGYSARLVTRVGDDPEGRELEKLLLNSGFKGGDLQIDSEHRTGAVNVSIDPKGVPVFDILPDVAFDYLEIDGTVRSILLQGPELVYYGTLIQRTSRGRRFVEEIFSSTDENVKFLCDLNLRPRCYLPEVVERSLVKADVLKLNEEELATITALLGMESSGDDPCRYIMETFGIEMIALTMGEGGSEIHDRQGNYSAGPAGGTVVIDTVGAGDAYSSILAIGYMDGWHPEKILSIASRFSAAICGIEGALPEADLFYSEFVELVGDDDDEG